MWGLGDTRPGLKGVGTRPRTDINPEAQVGRQVSKCEQTQEPPSPRSSCHVGEDTRHAAPPSLTASTVARVYVEPSCEPGTYNVPRARHRARRTQHCPDAECVLTGQETRADKE